MAAPKTQRRIFGRFGKSFRSASFAERIRKDFLKAEKAEPRSAAGRMGVFPGAVTEHESGIDLEEKHGRTNINLQLFVDAAARQSNFISNAN